MARVDWFGHGVPPLLDPEARVRVWIYMGDDGVANDGVANICENVVSSWYWNWNGRTTPFIGDIVAYEVVEPKTEGLMRGFETGATRSSDVGKHDYEGYLSPLVIERFAEYMTSHRKQADGGIRASDNWQKGMPLDVYMKSGFRHFVDWWKAHRGHHIEYGIEETLCALIFNIQGYLHEVLKAKHEVLKAKRVKAGN